MGRKRCLFKTREVLNLQYIIENTFGIILSIYYFVLGTWEATIEKERK